MYKIRNKINLNKKLNKCEYKMVNFHKCYNEGTILYNNKNVCKYHHDYYILGKNCNGCGLTTNICICNKYLNIIDSDDEEFEESDTEDIIKEPDKKCIICNNETIFNNTMCLQCKFKNQK